MLRPIEYYGLCKLYGSEQEVFKVFSLSLGRWLHDEELEDVNDVIRCEKAEFTLPITSIN